MVREYIRKSVSVQAAKISQDTIEDTARWCGGMPVTEISPDESRTVTVGLNFPTMDGPKRVSEGEYLIRNVDGSFTKKTQAEFENEYAEVE